MKILLAFTLFCASQYVCAASDEAESDAARSGENLLSSDQFEVDQFGRLVGGWVPMQHSSNISYEFLVHDGVLSIRRTGKEPWGQVFQRLDASSLAGRAAEFSIDVAGDFTDEYGEPFESTGIAAYVDARAADLRQRMMGVQPRFEHELDWEVGTGSHDWTSLILRFDIPENASSIQLQIKMTMGGELRARNPRLVVAED